MENIVNVATISIISATVCMMLGSTIAGVAEGSVAKQAMQSIAQQPDEAGEISKTLFMMWFVLRNIYVLAS